MGPSHQEQHQKSESATVTTNAHLVMIEDLGWEQLENPYPEVPSFIPKYIRVRMFQRNQLIIKFCLAGLSSGHSSTKYPYAPIILYWGGKENTQKLEKIKLWDLRMIHMVGICYEMMKKKFRTSEIPVNRAGAQYKVRNQAVKGVT